MNYFYFHWVRWRDERAIEIKALPDWEALLKLLNQSRAQNWVNKVLIKIATSHSLFITNAYGSYWRTYPYSIFNKSHTKYVLIVTVVLSWPLNWYTCITVLTNITVIQDLHTHVIDLLNDVAQINKYYWELEVKEIKDCVIVNLIP